MSQGRHRTPVRTGSGPCVQEPPHAGLPEDTWLEAAPPPALGACQIASCPLDPGGTASGAARDFTRQILGSWGLLVLAEDAAVIVSELVTNALCHGVRDANGAARDGPVRDGPVRDGAAHDRVELILLHRAGEMVCAVTDPGAGHPVLGTTDPAAEAGRGLCVIEALAASWGWTRLDTYKKAVWATLSIPGADGAKGHVGRPALSRRHAMPSGGRCVAARRSTSWIAASVSHPARRPPRAARPRRESSRRGAAASCGAQGAGRATWPARPASAARERARWPSVLRCTDA